MRRLAAGAVASVIAGVMLLLLGLALTSVFLDAMGVFLVVAGIAGLTRSSRPGGYWRKPDDPRDEALS